MTSDTERLIARLRYQSRAVVATHPEGHDTPRTMMLSQLLAEAADALAQGGPEVERLRGELEAAEQHIKILRALGGQEAPRDPMDEETFFCVDCGERFAARYAGTFIGVPGIGPTHGNANEPNDDGNPSACGPVKLLPSYVRQSVRGGDTPPRYCMKPTPRLDGSPAPCRLNEGHDGACSEVGGDTPGGGPREEHKPVLCPVCRTMGCQLPDHDSVKFLRDLADDHEADDGDYYAEQYGIDADGRAALRKAADELAVLRGQLSPPTTEGK